MNFNMDICDSSNTVNSGAKKDNRNKGTLFTEKQFFMLFIKKN